MIHTECLTKRYGAHAAVENLSLDVPEGDFFGLLGPIGLPIGWLILLRTLARRRARFFALD